MNGAIRNGAARNISGAPSESEDNEILQTELRDGPRGRKGIAYVPYVPMPHPFLPHVPKQLSRTRPVFGVMPSTYSKRNHCPMIFAAKVYPQLR